MDGSSSQDPLSHGFTTTTPSNPSTPFIDSTTTPRNTNFLPSTTSFSSSSSPSTQSIKALRDRYQRTGHRLGEGTFGEVIEAIDTVTGEAVALKRIYLKDTENDYFPVSAHRELQAHLLLMNEPYIVPCKNYYWETGGTLVVVMERMICDLGTLLEQRLHILPESVIRRFLYMILKGIETMHTYGIMHRDIKPQNILLNRKGICTLGDLGLTRPFKRTEGVAEFSNLDDTVHFGTTSNIASVSSIPSSISALSSSSSLFPTVLIPDPTMEYTNQISSRWYRAPEILYGSKFYGPAIDIWGIGCIGVELYTGKPFLPGTSDIEQLARMFKVRGTPTSLTWKNIEQLPDYDKIQFSKNDPVPLVTIIPRACNEGLDLLEKLLTLDPSRRITATEALQHAYFTSTDDLLDMDEIIPIVDEIIHSMNTVSAKPVENHRIGNILPLSSSSSSSSVSITITEPPPPSAHRQRFQPPEWNE